MRPELLKLFDAHWKQNEAGYRFLAEHVDANHRPRPESFIDIVKARRAKNRPGYDLLKEHGD
jgi:hypothetical protein